MYGTPLYNYYVVLCDQLYLRLRYILYLDLINNSLLLTTYPTNRGATSVLTCLVLYLELFPITLETRGCVSPDRQSDSIIVRQIVDETWELYKYSRSTNSDQVALRSKHSLKRL